MIVINTNTVESIEDKNGMVKKGPVYRKSLFSPEQTGGPGVALVTFSPGGRLNWHTHDDGQIIFYTEGKGRVATKEEERVVMPGTIVFFQPGEVHWHGAAEDSSATHLIIQNPGLHIVE